MSIPFYKFDASFTINFLLLILLCGLLLSIATPNDVYHAIETTKKCYLHDGRNPNGIGKAINYFEDLLTSLKQPEYDQGIFFIETKCSDSGFVELKPRYACSVETVAKANPDRDVFVVFVSPVGLPPHEQDWPPTVKSLMPYSNVHFRNVQLKKLFTNTPLEYWLESSALSKSALHFDYMLNTTRILLVSKYGGTYVDMNYMMVKSLDAMKRNWGVMENSRNKTCTHDAVFDFSHSGVGHIALNAVLRSLAENYKSDIRSPSSIIQMIGKLCNASGLVDEDSRQCSGIKLYPARRFYPFSGQDEFKLFNSSATNEVLNITQNIMGFHNCESAHIVNIVMGNGTAYDSIAQTHCPRIYAEHKEF